MSVDVVPRNLSLRRALAMARRLGLGVRYGRRTGEWLVSTGDFVVKHNARRKDASKVLVCALRQAAARGRTT